MKIRHIINPVAVNQSSDLFVAQPITFASLKSAKQMANERGIQVDICFTCYSEDSDLVPQDFRDAGLLYRSVLDIGVFRKQRKLPLIADIVGMALESDPVDFIIYTNVDIAVKPRFYIEVTRIIEMGYDAFTINRRTIHKHYNSPDQLALMCSEEGVKHPGHDCFIFSHKAAAQFNLGLGCIGANWIGRILLSNVMAFSTKFKTFKDEFLTFHIGDDRSWKIEEFNDYDLHNERELIKVIQYLLPHCNNEQSAELRQMLDFHISNQLDTKRIKLHRVHRHYKDEKSKLLGEQYKGSCSWNSPITLDQSPIFVVGYPRSGTTLMQSKLMTQSGIISLPETHFFTIIRGKLHVKNDRVVTDCLESIFSTLRLRLPLSVEAEQHLTRLAETNQLSPKMLFEAIVVDNLLANYSSEIIQGNRFIEKTPDHVQRLDILLHYYPNAKVVNMVRHPEKAIFSRRENFPGEELWDINVHIQGWKKCILAAEAISDKNRLLTIRLEDLIADEVTVLQRVCGFVEIPFDARTLSESTKAAELVALPWEHWKSINKKQISVDVLERRANRLTVQERQVIQNICSENLATYGYALDNGKNNKTSNNLSSNSNSNSNKVDANTVLENTKSLLALKAPKLKQTNKSVIFIGHSFHQKTGSSLFFIDFLESTFNVSTYWIDPYLENKNYPSTHLGRFDIAIFWQILPNDKILDYLDAERIICVPMYDSTGVYQDETFNQTVWEPYNSYSFLCFCRLMHQHLRSIGFNSFYIQYTPVISSFLDSHSSTNRKPKVLFVYRRNEISWGLVRELINPNDVESIHIHNIADPGQIFVPPSDEDVASYKITLTDWFPLKTDYETLLKTTDIFIAPRVFEGIGMSVLDAMAHGVCVIAPNKPTANEYIQNGDTGILYDYKKPSRLDISAWSDIGFRGKRSLAACAKKYAQSLKYLRLFLQYPPSVARADKFVVPSEGTLSDDSRACILLVFPHNPFLRQNGVQTRFMALLEYFKKRDFIVDILSHTNFVDDWDTSSADVKRLVRNVYLEDFIESRASGQVYSAWSPLSDFAFISLKNKFEDLIKENSYKFVVVGYVHWARLVEGVRGIAKVIMIEDCISINMVQRLGGKENYDLEKSLQDEASRIDLFDTAIFISPDELNIFSRRCNDVQLVHVPHMIETRPKTTARPDTKIYDLVFIGSDNPFNIAGMKWFLKNVWPLLAGKATLAIVGSVCDHIPEFFDASQDGNVALLGVVDDLDELYLSVRVAICPLHEGTGLKIKVVEALSHGVPVVSLPAGLIGITGNKGGCIEVSGAHAFAESISRLLTDVDRYCKHSESARNTVGRLFSEDVVYSELDKVFLTISSKVQPTFAQNDCAKDALWGGAKEELVTIITVTYNADQYLEKTILSVVNQDYKNIEYIIIDGGSTDSTIDIIKKYEDKISFWVSEKDHGIYDAMNKGVKHARGTYVNFMNAGDELYSFDVCSQIFADLPSGVDLVYGDTLFYDEKGNENIVKAVQTEELWKAMIFNHNSLFAKKELLIKYPFDLSYKIVADSKFVIECYLGGKSFVYKGLIVNKYLTGGFSDESSTLRTIERWKLVSDYKMVDQKLINEYYFQRLLNDRKALSN